MAVLMSSFINYMCLLLQQFLLKLHKLTIQHCIVSAVYALLERRKLTID